MKSSAPFGAGGMGQVYRARDPRLGPRSRDQDSRARRGRRLRTQKFMALFRAPPGRRREGGADVCVARFLVRRSCSTAWRCKSSPSLMEVKGTEPQGRWDQQVIPPVGRSDPIFAEYRVCGSFLLLRSQDFPKRARHQPFTVLRLTWQPTSRGLGSNATWPADNRAP
jgi:hypothetical protein